MFKIIILIKKNPERFKKVGNSFPQQFWSLCRQMEGDSFPLPSVGWVR